MYLPSNLVPVILPVYTTYENGIEFSGKSEYKIQTPGNHPKGSIQINTNLCSIKVKGIPEEKSVSSLEIFPMNVFVYMYLLNLSRLC